MYCAAAYSDSVPPMRGPMPTDSSRRWRRRLGRPDLLSTLLSPLVSDGVASAPGERVGGPGGLAGGDDRDAAGGAGEKATAREPCQGRVGVDVGLGVPS